MFKILLPIIMLSSFALSSYYYFPCEPTIAINTPLLNNAIKMQSQAVKNKAEQLEKKYEDYLKKTKEYNEALYSYKILQDEKNKLLINTKNELDSIKKIYFYDVEHNINDRGKK